MLDFLFDKFSQFHPLIILMWKSQLAYNVCLKNITIPSFHFVQWKLNGHKIAFENSSDWPILPILAFTLCVGFHDCSFPHTYFNIYTLSIFAFTRNVEIVPSCLFQYRVLVQILGTLCTLTKVRNTCPSLHIFAFLVYHEI